MKNKTEKLIKERVELKIEEKKVDIADIMKDRIKQRIIEIESDITDDVAQENFKMVVKTLEEISENGNINGWMDGLLVYDAMKDKPIIMFDEYLNLSTVMVRFVRKLLVIL